MSKMSPGDPPIVASAGSGRVGRRMTAFHEGKGASRLYVRSYNLIDKRMNLLTSTYIRRRLAGLGARVLTAEEFRRLFELRRPAAASLLHRLTRGGVATRLRRGEYVFEGSGVEEALSSPLFLGPRLVPPSYVSFWSALHHYGWTDQVPRTTFVATTRRSRRLRWQRFEWRFVSLAPHRFFGYRTARQGSLEFPVAEPEKAIVDAFLCPTHCGGTGLVLAASSAALGDLNLERLGEYVARIGSASLAQRLGFVLEEFGAPVEPARWLVGPTFAKLDPSGPRRGRFASRWKIIDNRRLTS